MNLQLQLLKEVLGFYRKSAFDLHFFGIFYSPDIRFNKITSESSFESQRLAGFGAVSGRSSSPAERGKTKISDLEIKYFGNPEGAPKRLKLAKFVQIYINYCLFFHLHTFLIELCDFTKFQNSLIGSGTTVPKCSSITSFVTVQEWRWYKIREMKITPKYRQIELANANRKLI